MSIISRLKRLRIPTVKSIDEAVSHASNRAWTPIAFYQKKDWVQDVTHIEDDRIDLGVKLALSMKGSSEEANVSLTYYFGYLQNELRETFIKRRKSLKDESYGKPWGQLLRAHAYVYYCQFLDEFAKKMGFPQFPYINIQNRAISVERVVNGANKVIQEFSGRYIPLEKSS